jgi:hypothetical protein
MSTKATVIDTNDSHIYEETNRQQSIFGKFDGYDIICDIDADSVKNIKFEGQYFEAEFKTNSAISEAVGKNIKIWGGDLLLVEMDNHYLTIEIKGGTRTAKTLIDKKTFK